MSTPVEALARLAATLESATADRNIDGDEAFDILGAWQDAQPMPNSAPLSPYQLKVERITQDMVERVVKSPKVTIKPAAKAHILYCLTDPDECRFAPPVLRAPGLGGNVMPGGHVRDPNGVRPAESLVDPETAKAYDSFMPSSLK